MSLIQISNLTFAYEGSYDTIFDNVSFQIDANWKLGFTGRNGRGKTTFMNLLMGQLEYSGSITASVDFSYFPFTVVDPTADTLTVVSQCCPEFEHWQLLREFGLLQLSEELLQRPFCTLSNGEQTKVLLAALFLRENNFLLLDEPTNHLDAAARALVSQYLRAKKGFILVSHDRAFLDNCIDHILSINKASIDVQRGNFSTWLANKERNDNFELSENEKLQKDIKRLQLAAKQSGAWADKVEATKIGYSDSEKSCDRRAYVGEKSRRMQQRRKNLERRQTNAIDEKTELLKNVETVETFKLTQTPYHTNTFVSLRDVSIHYGDKIACQPVSFTVAMGDRIALCGQNGSGKSSLLKLICGELLTYQGDFQKGRQLTISYVSQDTSFLRGSLTDFAQQHAIDESLFKAILRKFDFPRVQFEKDMSDFSGGQKKKVLLAKSLCQRSHLHIWDEPLNFIDVITRMQIESLLLTYQPTLLFVEHDSAFVERIATKKLLLS